MSGKDKGKGVLIELTSGDVAKVEIDKAKKARTVIPEREAFRLTKEMLKPANMIEDELTELQSNYEIPASFFLRLAEKDETIADVEDGWNALYVSLFEKGGFRLPLHPFAMDFLNAYGLPPSTLAPNGWKTLFGFMVVCKHLGERPSLRKLSLLYDLKLTQGTYCLSAKPNSKIFKTSSSTHPNKQLYFVCRPADGWGIPTVWRKKLNPLHAREGEEAEARFVARAKGLAKLQPGELIDVNQLCSPANLKETGISPYNGPSAVQK